MILHASYVRTYNNEMLKTKNKNRCDIKKNKLFLKLVFTYSIFIITDYNRPNNYTILIYGYYTHNIL